MTNAFAKCLSVDQTTETTSFLHRSTIMLHIYTHVWNGSDWVRDPEGQQFESLEAACHAAHQSARALIAEKILKGENAIYLEYRLHDTTNNQVGTVPMTAIVTNLTQA